MQSSPPGVPVCLYPQMLQAAAKEQEERAKGQDQNRSGPPDPSMICLYPESLKAAAEEAQKAEKK